MHFSKIVLSTALLAASGALAAPAPMLPFKPPTPPPGKSGPALERTNSGTNNALPVIGKTDAPEHAAVVQQAARKSADNVDPKPILSTAEAAKARQQKVKQKAPPGQVGLTDKVREEEPVAKAGTDPKKAAVDYADRHESSSKQAPAVKQSVKAAEDADKALGGGTSIQMALNDEKKGILKGQDLLNDATGGGRSGGGHNLRPDPPKRDPAARRV